MIYIWLIFGLIGIILIFFSGKETLKNRFRNCNYPFALCAIIGGLITFVIGLMVLHYEHNNPLND